MCSHTELKVQKRVFKLITGRTLTQGTSMESEGKFSDRYRKSVAVIELNPEDIKRLDIKDKVKVTSPYGSLVLMVKPSTEVPPGTAFIPMGPWANVLVEPATESTGMPKLKGVEVIIEPTEEEVTSLKEILKMYNVKYFEYKPLERPLKPGPKKVAENVPCPFCGDICDHLTIELEGEKIVRNIGGCALSVSKFLNYHKDRILKPVIRDEAGTLKEVSLDEAIEKAAKILANAKYPLLYGWSSTCNEAMELGVELAEVTRGVIDNTATVCHGPTTLGAQEVGTARATLGLIKHLADLIIFWGCNPVHAHPNHIARWVISEGKYVKGRKERKVVVIDVRKTTTANMADLFIQVEPGKDFELITALRMAVKDLEIEAPVIAGVPREKILELAEMMRSAKYSVIFVGMGLTMTGAKHRNLQELIKLAHDLNEWTRFAVIPMRGHFNVNGTNHVMLWLTGYPYAIDFSRGFPRMIPGVTTTIDLLVNGDVDAALIVASDPIAHLPQKAVEHLARIPVIVIDAKWSLTTTVADVIIPAGLVGIECEGTAYRMDDVPIRMKKLVDPPPGVLCDKEILAKLLEKVKELKGII